MPIQQNAITAFITSCMFQALDPNVLKQAVLFVCVKNSISPHLFSFLEVFYSSKQASLSLCQHPQLISLFREIRLEALILLLLEQDLNLSLSPFNQVPILAATKLSTKENKLYPIKGLNWISQCANARLHKIPPAPSIRQISSDF